MKFILSITFLGFGIAGLMGGVLFDQYIYEIFLGMIAPLIVGTISIQLSKNVFKKSPQKLTASLTKSFFMKMIFFAAYFIIILSFYTFEPIPFVVSFTGFFILFYIIEAVFLQKLIQSNN